MSLATLPTEVCTFCTAPGGTHPACFEGARGRLADALTHNALACPVCCQVECNNDCRDISIMRWLAEVKR